MDEEKLNLSIRKFLKQVGVTSQREIELAVRDAAGTGRLETGPMTVKVTLECPGLGLEHTIEGKLEAG